MKIPVVYVFDEGFAEATIVSAISLLKNNKEQVEFHLLYPSRMERSGNKVEKEIIAQGGEVIKHPCLEEWVSKYKVSAPSNRGKNSFQPWNITIFLKLMIHQMVQKDKVIFIDGDTIVGECLKKLFQFKLENKIVAAVLDNHSENMRKYWKNLEVDVEHYFNSGVMLLNLKKLREIDFLKECEASQKKYGKFCKYSDQDLYNIILNGYVSLLPSHFNIQAWWGLTDKIWQKQLISFRHGILHFVGNVKPWHLWHRPNAIKFWKSFSDQSKTLEIKFQKVRNIEQAISYSHCLDLEEKYQQSSFIKTKIIEKLIENIGSKK